MGIVAIPGMAQLFHHVRRSSRRRRRYVLVYSYNNKNLTDVLSPSLTHLCGGYQERVVLLQDMFPGHPAVSSECPCYRDIICNVDELVLEMYELLC